MAEEKLEDGFLKILRFIAPGTALREGLDNILRAQTGALIIIGGDNEDVMKIVDGGFDINADFTPARLYELAKMDGGIILSNDGKRILRANTQLVPDPSIPSTETGTRHRTAERVARQTSELVVSISQRRNVITLYQEVKKYVLKDIRVILDRANQAIQTLEKYRSVLNEALNNLSALEFEDLVTILDVTTALQRIAMVLRISGEIERYISELGIEGRLVSMQLEELLVGVKQEGKMIIKDYLINPEEQNIENMRSQIFNTNMPEELMDLSLIAKALGFAGNIGLDTSISPRGYRILSKIPRLPATVTDNLIETFKNLQRVMEASIGELDDVEGIGEVRAKAIKEGLRRLKELTLLDRHI